MTRVPGPSLVRNSSKVLDVSAVMGVVELVASSGWMHAGGGTIGAGTKGGRDSVGRNIEATAATTLEHLFESSSK